MIGSVAETDRQRPLCSCLVLQLCISFGLSRIRRQRIGAQTLLFLPQWTFLCRAAGQDLPHVEFCLRFAAAPPEKEGHTRCAAERRDPRAAGRRASVSHQDRSWRVRPGSRMLFRDWSFGPQEGSLGLTRHWSSRRCCWPWCIPAVLWRVVCQTEFFHRGAKKMELWSTSC